MATYIADTWHRERERLAALSRALDPTTIRLIDRLGVSAGASCLEVGAGSGSIAAWLSERVGREGQVVALDLDTLRLASVAATHRNVELREGDVLTADFREGSFDLVHARLVFGHLADRKRALARLVAAARPGAWLLLEDADFLWTDVGMQPIYPQHYVERYFRVWRAAVVYLRATVQRLGQALVESQTVSPRDLVEFDDLMSDPNTIFTASPTFSVWGRRPSSQ